MGLRNDATIRGEGRRLAARCTGADAANHPGPLTTVISYLAAAPRPQLSRSLLSGLLLATMFALALAAAPRTLGVTRTWTGLGPTNNWSDALNWSGNAVPGAADVASFDATSSKNATINAGPTTSVLGLTVAAGYAGTISQAAGVALTIGATGFSQAGGTFTGNAAAITVNGPFAISGGAFTSTTGTLSIAGNYTHTAGGSFAANGGAVAFITGAATIDVNASETFNDLRFTAGAKTVAAGDTLVANGLLTLTAGSIVTGTVAAQGDVSVALGYGGGSGTLLISGGGAQTLTDAATSASGNLPNFVINKPSGTLTLAGTIRTTNNWTYSGGGLAPGASTVFFAGGTVTGDHALNTVDFRATTTIAAGTTLTVGGSLTLTAGSLNTGTVAARGDISQVLGYTGGSGTLLINGIGAQAFSGASTTASGGLPAVVINKPSGTLTLAGTIRTAGNWTYTAGTLDAGTSTVVFAGGTVTGNHTLNAVDFRANTTIAAGTTLSVGGLLSLSAGNLNTGTVAALADVSQALGYGGGSGTLLIGGGGTQTLTGASTTASGSLPVLVINKPSGTLNLSGTIRTSSSWTYTAGTLAPGASTVVFAGGTVTGNHTLNAIDFRANTTIAAGTTLTAGGLLSLSAGSLNTGTVAALSDISQALGYGGGTGTLLVNGAAGQTLTGASTTASGSLPALVINKPSGTLSLVGTIRTLSNWTYTAGTLDPGTSTVVFGATLAISGSHSLADVIFNGVGSTYTVAAGTTLTVAGALTLTDGNINTGTVAALGDVSQASTFDGNTGTLLIGGAGAQLVTGSSTPTVGNLPNFVINKPSGTLTLAGTIRTSHNWTYTAGTLNPGTSTVFFAGGTVTGNHTLNAVDFRATTTIAAGTTLSAGGLLTLTAGNLNTGTVAALGDVSQVLGYGGGTGTLLISGGGTQTLTGASTTASGNLPLLVINKPSGTLTLAGTIRTSNNWTYTAGTLDPGTSTVVFAGGTVTGSHTLNAVDFRATTTIAAGTTLTAGGLLSLTAGNLNTGTVAALADVSQALGYGGGSGTLLIDGAGAQTLTGASTTASGSLPALVINKPSGTLTLAGTIRTTSSWTYTTGTLDPGTSTVVFAATLAISGSHSLADVIFNGAGSTYTVAAGTTLTVTGTLTLTDGNINTGTVAARGPISQASTFDGNTGTLLINGSGAQTFTGASTAAAGNLPSVVINKPLGTLTLVGTIRTTHNWTYTAGIVAPGTSTVVFAGGTVTSAGMGFYDVTANGGTTTLGSAMSVGHDLTVSAGTFTTSAGGFALSIGRNLSIAGTLQLNSSAVSVGGDITLSGTFTAGTSTVTLNGSGGQSIGGPSAMTFYNLVASDPGGVAMAANVTITNVLTLSAGSFTVGAHTLTISNPLAGTITNLVAGATSSITVTGAAAGIVLPSSVAQLNNLTLNNTNGLGLQADLAVLGTLTLTNGPLTTGPYTLRIAPGGSVVRTGGRVNGYLQKHVPAGAGTALTYEVGDATRYAPVSVVFGTVTTAGELTASTTSGDHPLIASSGIAPTLSVNRFWTMTNAGVVFDTYDATFTFSAPDLDVGANPSLFIVAKLDAGTWTLPAVGTRTPTTTQALGMTSFSDFQLGQPAAADLELAASDGLATVTAGDGLSHAYTITATNGGPSDATTTSLTVSWPSGFAQGTITPSQGSCSPVGAGPDFSCDLGTIAAGGSATVTVAFSVPAATPGGIQTLTASVTSPVGDPDPTNNSATDDTTVIEAATLLVTKSDGLPTVVAGTTGHAYTITVTNSGPSDADTVVLDDSVPSAFSAGSPGADLGGDCSTSVGNTIHCTLPASLGVGATWTITVPYAVAASVAPQAVTQHRDGREQREHRRHRGQRSDRRDGRRRSRADRRATG